MNEQNKIKAQKYFQEAMEYGLQKKYEYKVALLEKVIELDEEHLEAYEELGETLFVFLFKTEESLKYFQKLHELAKNKDPEKAEEAKEWIFAVETVLKGESKLTIKKVLEIIGTIIGCLFLIALFLNFVNEIACDFLNIELTGIWNFIGKIFLTLLSCVFYLGVFALLYEKVIKSKIVFLIALIPVVISFYYGFNKGYAKYQQRESLKYKTAIYFIQGETEKHQIKLNDENLDLDFKFNQFASYNLDNKNKANTILVDDSLKYEIKNGTTALINLSDTLWVDYRSQYYLTFKNPEVRKCLGRDFNTHEVKPFIKGYHQLEDHYKQSKTGFLSKTCTITDDTSFLLRVGNYKEREILYWRTKARESEEIFQNDLEDLCKTISNYSDYYMSYDKIDSLTNEYQLLKHNRSNTYFHWAQLYDSLFHNKQKEKYCVKKAIDEIELAGALKRLNIEGEK